MGHDERCGRAEFIDQPGCLVTRTGPVPSPNTAAGTAVTVSSAVRLLVGVSDRLAPRCLRRDSPAVDQRGRDVMPLRLGGFSEPAPSLSLVTSFRRWWPTTETALHAEVGRWPVDSAVGQRDVMPDAVVSAQVDTPDTGVLRKVRRAGGCQRVPEHGLGLFRGGGARPRTGTIVNHIGSYKTVFGDDRSLELVSGSFIGVPCIAPGPAGVAGSTATVARLPPFRAPANTFRGCGPTCTGVLESACSASCSRRPEVRRKPSTSPGSVARPSCRRASSDGCRGTTRWTLPMTPRQGYRQCPSQLVFEMVKLRPGVRCRVPGTSCL